MSVHPYTRCIVTVPYCLPGTFTPDPPQNDNRQHLACQKRFSAILYVKRSHRGQHKPGAESISHAH